jgi:hypothetical protein
MEGKRENKTEREKEIGVQWRFKERHAERNTEMKTDTIKIVNER